jgi:hypothetical protein
VAALIKVLGTGLEMFNSDEAIGNGQFPPSLWSTAATPGGSPYTAIGQTDTTKPGTSQEPYVAYGAQTLIWGLAGADMLGTPGFQTRLNGPDGLYTIVNARPLYPRASPFVDITKLQVRNPIEGRDIYASYAPYNARANIPVIMDDFDNPILYYRADPKSSPGPEEVDRYFYSHNAPFCNPSPPSSWVESDHMSLDWIACPNDRQNRDGRPFATGFDLFIHNPSVQTLRRPHNYDSFLLLSAGPDGFYGTRDDIGNFPVDLKNIPTGY